MEVKPPVVSSQPSADSAAIRFAVKVGARAFFVPIKSNKEHLATFTVRHFRDEVLRRYAALLQADEDSSEKKAGDVKPEPVVITSLKVNNTQLMEDDLLSDVAILPNHTPVGEIVAVLKGEKPPSGLPALPGSSLSGSGLLNLAAPTLTGCGPFPGLTPPPTTTFHIEGEGDETAVVIDEQNLRNALRSALGQHDLVYEEHPKIIADTLLPHIEELREPTNSGHKVQFAELVKFLDTKYKDTTTKIANMMKDRRLTYNTLWHIFHKGIQVYGFDSGEDDFLVGMEINAVRYHRGMFPVFEIRGNVIKSDGSRFGLIQKSFYIGDYQGTKEIDSFPVHVLDEKTKAVLNARGKLFERVGIGAHYKSYPNGNMYIRTSWGGSWFKAAGRVMVDGTAFNRFNPSYQHFRLQSSHYSGYSSSQLGEFMGDKQIPPEKLYMTWPTLPGFSFVCKRWGEVVVSRLEDVHFDEDAYRRLVLPPEKKRLIQALVENSQKAFADIITGKGGGCIFLLHGSPGVGKTLTAEAIAEMLHRPLYSVSVGELGTDTSTLERTLQQILEVAATWNAVILIDEADIFLEKRTENDIIRNAMVGIFLKLLEYHQGVLFLTTNRVKCFDEAFHSRISVALKYEDLDVEARQKVWDNLLEAAGMAGSKIDVAKWAAFELNGRQIRSTIRLAQALAASEKSEGGAGNDHIGRCVMIAKIGISDFLPKAQLEANKKGPSAENGSK